MGLLFLLYHSSSRRTPVRIVIRYTRRMNHDDVRANLAERLEKARLRRDLASEEFHKATRQYNKASQEYTAAVQELARVVKAQNELDVSGKIPDLL